MRPSVTVSVSLLLLTCFVVASAAAQTTGETGPPEFTVETPEVFHLQQEPAMDVTLEDAGRYESVSAELVLDGRTLDSQDFQGSDTVSLTVESTALGLPGDQNFTVHVEGQHVEHGDVRRSTTNTVEYRRFVRDFRSLVVEPHEEVERVVQEFQEDRGISQNVYLFSNVTDSDVYVLLTDEELDTGVYDVTGFEHPPGEYDELPSGLELCIYGEVEAERVEMQEAEIEDLRSLDLMHGQPFEMTGNVVGLGGRPGIYAVQPTGSENATFVVGEDGLPETSNATLRGRYIDDSVLRYLYQTTYGAAGREPYLYLTSVEGGEAPPEEVGDTTRDRGGSEEGEQVISNDGGRSNRDDGGPEDSDTQGSAEATPLTVTTLVAALALLALTHVGRRPRF